MLAEAEIDKTTIEDENRYNSFPERRIIDKSLGFRRQTNVENNLVMQLRN